MKLTKLINELVAYVPDEAPVISVYLDTTADENGRPTYEIWFKNEISEAGQKFEKESAEAVDFDAAIERIRHFLEHDLEPATRGTAIFASASGDGFFQTVQIDEPFPHNRFFMFDRPHLFPLARVIAQNPRYLALWADTNKAEIYIFGGENHLNVEAETRAKVEEIQGDKTRRTHVGGWSQARYQRHIANFHLQHAKETVDEVEKLMREAKIEQLVLCGDEATIMPILRPQFSKESEDRIVGVLNMSQYATEEQIHEQTLEIVRAKRDEVEKESVDRLYNAARSAAGLGALGVEKTLEALSNGQVEELLISSVFDSIKYNPRSVDKVLEAYAPGDDNSTEGETPDAREKRQIADELIIRAMNSAAKITFVNEELLLAEAGGVGAVLRYNMNATAAI
jgi:peptide chain release factor subunit 1